MAAGSLPHNSMKCTLPLIESEEYYNAATIVSYFQKAHKDLQTRENKNLHKHLQMQTWSLNMSFNYCVILIMENKSHLYHILSPFL